MLRSEPRGGKRAFALDLDGFRIGGKLATAEVPPPEGRPIILAIHGGTYSCDYFDVPGYSLLDRARARGFDVLALDRPGYRGSTPLPEAPDMIATNAECLARTLPGILHRFDAADAPVFIVAHSIGAAIAITMAAAQPEWLAGLAISGVGATTPPESAEAYAHLLQTYPVEMPRAMKDAVMFGPPESHPADMPAASHAADTTVPRSELTDITGGWKDRVAALAAAVAVPVHYRQGEHEKLWLNGGDIPERFGWLFSRSPAVDCAMVANAGHCIDFHHAGAAFQDAQLTFAAGCSAA